MQICSSDDVHIIFFWKSCFLLYILTRFSKISDLSHEVGKAVWSASQCNFCRKTGVEIGCGRLMLHLKALSSENIFLCIYIHNIKTVYYFLEREIKSTVKLNNHSLRRLLLLVA